MSNLKEHSTIMSKLINEAISYDNSLAITSKKVNELDLKRRQNLISDNQYQKELQSILRGKSLDEIQKFYKYNILQILHEIKERNDLIYEEISSHKKIQPQLPSKIPTPSITEEPIKKIDIEKKQVKIEAPREIKPATSKVNIITPSLKKIDVDIAEIKRFAKEYKKKKQTKELSYTVYKTNPYAKISNYFMENLTFNITRKYPNFFQPLYESLKLANIKLLSKTYIDIMLFSTILIFPISTIIYLIVFLSIIKALALGIITSLATFAFIYLYPHTIIKTKRMKIKTELVFAIIHMAAVSGSGTPPHRIFKLLIESKEYPELEWELKRIINNMNIFGYNLVTSLKIVASTTPSGDLKELLNGMVSTIETGGDITTYLKDKAEDSLNQYRLDQRKYLETISNYSDIYTGILIAAPLLLIITLAILEKISPTIGGLQISTIAAVGTYLGMPLINIAFLTFINILQPEL